MENGNIIQANSIQKILSVANGWGEASSFIQVGNFHRSIEITKIEKESKVIGKGYYDYMTIYCYVAYSEDGKQLIEINEGPNVEIRYFADALLQELDQNKPSTSQ